MSILVEQTLNEILYAGGINTLLPVDFSGSSAVALPTATTINGVPIASIASVTSSLTTGALFSVTGTGVYTGVGANQIVMNSLTSGVAERISITSATSGIGHKVLATAATLTTGRYYSANDGALEVFGVGANGHLHTLQTTAPTAATNATGISAVAITAGSTDVCGTITTTGTPASGTVLTITFNKTYTTAPKFVVVSPANAAAGGVNTMPIVTQTATTFVLTWPAGGTYAATPSFMYFVIA